MNKGPLLIAFIAVLLLQCSCNNTLSKMYGIRNTDSLTTDSIRLIIAKDLVLRSGNNYIADTAYVNQLYYRFGKDSLLYKDIMQPMQAMYFDTAGNLVSYHINCNAGGFPNLKWNRNNAFDTYPPLTQTRCFKEITLSVIEQGITPLNTGTEPTATSGETVIVFWNYQVYKQSSRLLQLVQDNIKQHNKQAVRLLFVNTDMLYK